MHSCIIVKRTIINSIAPICDSLCDTTTSNVEEQGEWKQYTGLCMHLTGGQHIDIYLRYQDLERGLLR